MLCLQQKPLRKSHLIPKFVYKWLKETSVTGYLRQAINANIRLQDGTKVNLLCDDCELLLSKYENEFAKRVFVPYVEKELDSWGSAQGKIKCITYEEWLLKFIISLQFRHLVTLDEDLKDDIGLEFFELLKTFIPVFRDYLSGNRNDTGSCRSYIIFLQNLVFGEGYLPEGLNEKTNFYLLRSVDGTVMISKSRLGIYTKIGPIVLITSVLPSEIKSMDNIVVKKKGAMKMAQHLKDSVVNRFIIVDRPNETMNLVNYSDKQKKVIHDSFEKNKDKVGGNMVTNVQVSDLIISKHKGSV